MTTRRPAFPRLALLASAVATAGCGAEVYQSRIGSTTVPLFNYQRELAAGLGPSWRRGEVGIRLPSTFKEIPAPKKKAGTAPGRDPRLPPGYDAELPGLIAGFKGTMRSEVPGAKPKEVPVYAYVLSNRYLLSSREPTAKPQAYDATLLNNIAAALRKGNVSVTSLKPLVPTDTLPLEQRPFAPGLRFDQTVLEAEMAGTPMRYELYIRREPPLQLAVLFIVPRDAPRDEQVKKRIDLSLQTLRIQSGGGSAGTTPGGAGAGSTGSAGPGF